MNPETDDDVGLLGDLLNRLSATNSNLNARILDLSSIADAVVGVEGGDAPVPPRPPSPEPSLVDALSYQVHVGEVANVNLASVAMRLQRLVGSHAMARKTYEPEAAPDWVVRKGYLNQR